MDVDKLADSRVHLVYFNFGESHVNIDNDQDVTIDKLTCLTCDVFGYRGKLDYDRTNPGAAPRKLLDVRRLRSSDWTSRTPPCDGPLESYVLNLKSLAGSVAARG